MRDPDAVAVGIMLLLALMLQGCGHKGPLFMPPPPAPGQAHPVAGQ